MYSLFRLKAGLKLQNAANKKEVEKGVYLLEQPAGNESIILQ